ncbi:MAG: amidase, partial [Acidovorax sp.]|nr:amidase [Acidovorax sp.]
MSEVQIKAWAWLPAMQEAAQAVSGPLAGLTFGVKDVMDVKGMPTRYGCEGLPETPKDWDATVVAQLRAAGATPIGKTVTAEFAFVKPGPTRNPHSLEHTPGGSSSGSAAAVAAGMVDFALGTQTGGSMMRPAAYCGVVGFKPSFGLVHRQGMMVTAETL